MSARTNDIQRNQDAVCYVGNLDDRVDDALVWELMLQAGPVVRVHVPRDRVTGQHNAFAFAEFQTPPDADYAMKILNGVKLYGRSIRVDKASSDRRNVDIGANLFVGNLDADADERDLLDAFSAFGTIVSLQVRAKTTPCSVFYSRAGSAALRARYHTLTHALSDLDLGLPRPPG